MGRDRELAELRAAVTQTVATSGALFLLAGEPGIGKTRLASEVASRARELGARTAWGRCWEAGGAPTFWPWREALESLGMAFPEGSAIAAPDPAEARFALFREVAGVLGREAAREPLVIVLEDLHAADRSTLLLLEFLASQLRTLPILVIGTYRDLEANLRADTGDALARIGRAGRVLQLARLREADVTLLVRDAIEDADDRLASKVFETTNGNPLFVDEIVRDVRARGIGGGIPIPLGVREIIRQRLGLVSVDTRRVLEAGAVLGVEFDAAGLAGLVPGALAVLDDATRSGLVTARGDRFRFSHALYREALYHDLPRTGRQELHRAAARALAATGAPLAETAHHLLESGPDAAAEAIDHAIRAASLALDMFAFEDATALLERARGAVPQDPVVPALRGRVLIALGEARIRSGDAGGRELCVEAAQIARDAGDPALLALAGLAYGSVFTMGGVDPVLVGILQDALAQLPAADSPLRARVMARLAAARQPSAPAERPRDIALALEAITVARRVADRRDLLGVLHAACGALYGAAHPSIRLPIALEAERLAEELGDTTRLLNARVRLASDHLELADFTAYGQLAMKYAELANRIGRAAGPWRVPLMRSMIALSTGRFDESERWQAEARTIDPDQPRARRAVAYHRICSLRAAEHHAELRAALPELRGLWLEMPYGGMLAEPRVAALLARIGDDDEVRTILAKLPDQAFLEQINAVSIAEAVWATADSERAAQVLPVLQMFGEDRWTLYWLDVEICEAPNARGLAYLTAILGDWAETDRLFAYALRSVESVGSKAIAARMRFELGDLFVRLGNDLDRAAGLLTEARASALALGLPELVALIDRRHPLQRTTTTATTTTTTTTTAPTTATTTATTPTTTATAAPAHTFSLVLEGEYYAVARPSGVLRFKATRGMQYLATLVERPGIDVHVLELAGSTDADRGDAGELLDAPALRDYRARLETLRDAAEDAEARGDTTRAETARDEMEAIAAELAKGTARGGKARRAESAVDRARSAVQRRIKDALDRISEQAPELGTWLRRSVQTGNHCCFRPVA